MTTKLKAPRTGALISAAAFLVVIAGCGDSRDIDDPDIGIERGAGEVGDVDVRERDPAPTEVEPPVGAEVDRSGDAGSIGAPPQRPSGRSPAGDSGIDVTPGQSDAPDTGIDVEPAQPGAAEQPQ